MERACFSGNHIGESEVANEHAHNAARLDGRAGGSDWKGGQ